MIEAMAMVVRRSCYKSYHCFAGKYDWLEMKG